MIRLGLRLTLGGGREVAVRLIVTVAAVALGVGLLLMSLAGMNGVKTQNDRSAWLNTGSFAGNGPPGQNATTPATTPEPVWWLSLTDYFGTKTIHRIDVAGTGPDSPVPPGIAHLPGPGQYYASPALTDLLRSTPASELADRFPGREIGVIGSAALPAPDSLIIVVGYRSQHLASDPRAAAVTEINTSVNSGGPQGLDTARLQTILAVGALALLFPVLILIATAARLATSRREQRFAAMRLVGATPRQVNLISTVDSCVAGLGGVAFGFAVFFLLRPLVANANFTGQRFAAGDLSLTPLDVVLVALGVPVAAALAALTAVRRVQISPLGVSRRVTPPAPRAYRLLPLVAGIVELLYFVVVGRPKSTGGQIQAYVSGCLLIMAGLVISGPWLTMIGSRIMAVRTNRTAVLIAGRRMSDNPRAAFRAISGLIIALFATSVSVGIITTIIDYQSGSSGTAANDTLFEQFGDFVGPGIHVRGQGQTSAVAVPTALVSRIGSIRGVQGVTVIYDSEGAQGDQNGPDQPLQVLASCAQLAHTPAIGSCPEGATTVAIDENLANHLLVDRHRASLASTVWPAAAISVQGLQALPARAVVVETDGSRSTIETARTALGLAYPSQGSPLTLGEIDSQSVRQITELQQMTNVVIVASLVIAGCSLAVSVTGGITERKRPFSLLRLSGVPVAVLRSVVALEAAVPLLVISVVSAGMGFLAAALFLNSQLGESLQPPHAGYYGVVGSGLVASLAIIMCTLPIIRRITGPELARNE